MNSVSSPRPQLKIRRINLDTGRENVVVISRRSKALRAEVFPLYETMSLLGGEGYPIRFGWLNAT